MADEVWALDGRTTWHRPPSERADDTERELSAARAEIDRLTRELDRAREELRRAARTLRSCAESVEAARR